MIVEGVNLGVGQNLSPRPSKERRFCGGALWGCFVEMLCGDASWGCFCSAIDDILYLLSGGPMKELLKGLGSVAIGIFAGAGLAAISFLAIEVLIPPVSHLTEIHLA